jgi:hypothetical protein
MTHSHSQYDMIKHFQQKSNEIYASGGGEGIDKNTG